MITMIGILFYKPYKVFSILIPWFMSPAAVVFEISMLQRTQIREFSFAVMDKYMVLIRSIEQPTYNDHENIITID
jgi:hypothetical protein